MSKYIDYKVETWIRVKFNEDINLQEIIDKLEKGTLPPDFGNEYDVEYENLTETEEFIRPIENDGQSTIEVYNGNDFQELIWDNSFESEIKRKNKKRI
jgi:hypothetical protein